MSEQYKKADLQQTECGPAPTNGNGHGDPRAIANRLEQAVKLLAELADDVGRFAPEHKHTFEEAGAAMNEFGTLLMHSPESTNGHVVRIVAPMPGVILRCEKKPGEDVKKGEVVLILDAMKVENPIRVPVAGKIISIRHGEGERVAKGSVLAVVNQ